MKSKSPTIVEKNAHKHRRCQCAPMFMNPRPVDGKDYEPTNNEHIANCVTHIIPAFLSIFAIVAMLYQTGSNFKNLLGSLPYGIGMFLTFATSSSYHVAFAMDHKWTGFLKKCDHGIIYLFIASHYFPWILMTDVGQNNMMGNWFLLFVSIIAIIGVVKTITGSFQFVPALVLYFTLGLVGGLLGKPMMISQVAIWSVLDMIIGGLLYAIGVIAFKM
jgi:channel protein (hemolysin III family)